MLDLPPPSNSRQQDYYILSKPSFATVTRPGDTSNADVCIRISVKVEKATWCKYRCKMMWILQGWCQICGPQPVLQFELLWCPPSTMKCGSFAQGSSHAVAIVNMTASWLKGRSGAKPLSELECCCGKKNATRSSVRANILIYILNMAIYLLSKQCRFQRLKVDSTPCRACVTSFYAVARCC